MAEGKTDSDFLGKTDGKPVTTAVIITQQDIDSLKLPEPVDSPIISISASELPPEPPIIRISNRDLARNKPGWNKGGARDLWQAVVGKGNKITKNSGWWGGDELAGQKMSRYQRIEAKRQAVDDILDQVQILPDNLNRQLSDIELSTIEVRLLEDGKEILTTTDNREISINLVGEAQDIRGEIQQLARQQKDALQDLYGSRSDFSTPIVMERHIPQKYMGQEGIWSCAVASSLNALHALGVAQSTDTEDSIIADMGGMGVFANDGGLPMGHVNDFMQKRGMIARSSSNVIELMQTLENGGVAVVCRQAAAGEMGHAVMISGAETQNGQVMLRVNDPLGRIGLTRESAAGMVDQLNYLSTFANMYLIENPENLPQITILPS